MRSEARLLDKELNQQIESFRQRLSSALLSLPENPNAQNIQNNIAVVPSSQLSSRTPWTSSYHIFHQTYKEIAELIQSATPHKIRNILIGVIKNGRYRNKAGRFVQVHPKAVQQIKALWESN